MKKILGIVICFASLFVGCTSGSESTGSGGISTENNESSESDIVETPVEKKPTVIGNLEIAAEDGPEPLGWFESSVACTDMGDGWRLPTIEEMHIIYDNEELIGGLPDYGTYWTSTTYENQANQVWTLSVSDGKQYQVTKSSSNYRYRPVRDK